MSRKRRQRTEEKEKEMKHVRKVGTGEKRGKRIKENEKKNRASLLQEKAGTSTLRSMTNIGASESRTFAIKRRRFELKP